MMERLLKLLPQGLSRRLARGAVPIVVGIVFLILVAGLALAALVSPGTLGLSAARVAETRQLPDTFQTAGLATTDSDHDGLPDALENYLYGTDPGQWNSSGLGIPDGWLAQYGYDPLSAVTKDARGAAPPADVLSQLPAYAQGYPDSYRPALLDYYNWGKPAGYQPGTDAPWWSKATGVDPTQWDQARTGVPTGWLLHYGLDPLRTNVDAVAPGAKGNLTVRDAFTHNTDPLARDSDLDGLDDWTEIHVTRTDPAKFSTAGTGMADGWALHFGLNPFDANAGSQDPDRDGLTNLEEFVYSYNAFRGLVTQQGLSVLYAKGLDPTNGQTANTGIPDGWYVKYNLSPFGEDVDRVIANASDWPLARDLPPAAAGPTASCTEVATNPPAAGQPIPDCAMTIKDAYLYNRPPSWNETKDGVWWGGTNPATGDTDGDGVPDAVEIRGWYANETLDTGPDAKARTYLARANPLQSDSDGDGLTDREEYVGQTTCGGGATRTFPPTNPLNRDTAFSGLSDLEKVCGVVRGDAKYDITGPAGSLDPTKADSAGDLMKDGPRLEFWAQRFDQYRVSPLYPYNGSAYRTLSDWTKLYHRFDGMSEEQVVAQFRPDGDVDGDGIPNVLDSDPSGGLTAQGDAGAAKTKVYFAAGPKMDPTLYRLTEFASSFPRPATDPANPDTDGDGLPDAWEIRYGTFDPAIHPTGGWNLDPSRADSDGNGVTDDKENLDGDVVTWYSYAAAGRTSHAYSFSVKDELLAGTDPNKLSTTGDGVSDGWKAFWGSRIDAETFPSLLSANDPRVGDSILGDPARRAEIEKAMLASPIQPLAKLSCDAGGCKETGYVRFACDAADASQLDIPCDPLATGAAQDRCAALAAATVVAANEQKDINGCLDGPNLKGVATKILPIEGVFRLTYADQQRLRVNPFLADTDGDGAPDAYEAYMLGLAKQRNPVSTFPDPANPETADRADPDKDGLSLADECHAVAGACTQFTFTMPDATGFPKPYGAGSDPNLADTDGDGIEDGIEVAAGTVNPLVPKDVDDFRNALKDSDYDGVPDYLELTGFGKTQYNFDSNVKTDPQRASTAGNGLLDGPDRFSTQVPAAVAAGWNATGIAHKTLANGTVEFYGAGTFHGVCGCLPTVLDSSGTGIPDGWYAYYLRSPTEGTPPVAQYTLHRPSWWDESKMGVWWWGAPADATSTPADLNANGLNDNNGEDPFPSLANGTLVTSQGTLRSLDEARAWVLSAPTPEVMRQRAQSLGDAPGEPAFGRARSHDSARAATQITDLVVANGTGLVVKGVPFPVTGKLLAGGAPVANRTILVSMFSPGATSLLGAGFTNADGTFSLQADLAAGQTVTIPAGRVLLGETSGAVVLPFDPATVGAGAATGSIPNQLVVWTYNTSVALPNPTAFSAAAPVSVTVHSDTVLDTTVNPVAENGQTLVGDLRLADKGGGALQEPINVTWSGGPDPRAHPYETDRAGHLNLTNLNLPISVRQPGVYRLGATFASTDPNLNSSMLAFDVDVRSPASLAVALSAPGGTVGDVLGVTGSLATRDVTLADGSVVPGAPVPGATVHVLLGALDQPAVTDGNGNFSVSFPIPPTLAAGSQTVLARFGGDELTGAAEGSAPLAVKRTAQLVDLTTLAGPRSLSATLSGRLVDNAGDGILGTVSARGAKGFLGSADTDDTGAFHLDVSLGALPLGLSGVNVTYPGDRDHGEAQNLTTARVTSATRLVLSPLPSSLIRGQPLAVSARLLDDQDAPVAQQAVAVAWRGEKVGTAVTDAQGSLAFQIATNLTDRPALADVGLVFAPRATSVYQGALASGRVQVLQGASLSLDPQRVTRGFVAATGSLVDDQGHPLAAAPVTLRVGGLDFGETRTARNGTFLVERPLPAGIGLGDITALATFPGVPGVAPANATATWAVRSPLTLELTSLAPLVRGETAALAGTLVDDRGQPVDATLAMSLAGQPVGTLLAHAGKLSGGVAVPADLARGDATLWINATATGKYDALAKALDVVVKVRPKVEVHLPALAVRGFSVAGDVTLLDDKGQPLRNTSFAYALGKGASPLFGITDAEGRATLASVTPLSGDASFAITVRGAGDVLGTEYRSQAMTIVGPSTPLAYATLIAIALVILLVIAAVIVIAILRRRQLGEAREILQEAIQELLAGNEYQGVIFLAYRRFSAHLARYGYAEKESETPREFAGSVRKALPVGAVPLRELIRLFEEARYSDHAIGSEERDHAVASLAAVRNELDGLLGRKAVNA